MNWIRPLAWVGLSMAMSIAGSATLDKVQQKATLRVALYDSYPPYSYTVDGRMRGPDVDIAAALAKALGVALSIMPVTASDEAMEDDLRNAIWKGHYLGGGTADVMLHVPVDPRFAAANDQVSIFAPYWRETTAIAHDTQRIPRLDGVGIFTDQPVVVELESIGDLYLSRVDGGVLIDHLIHVRSVDEGCQTLLQGRAAAMMATRAQLEHCLRGASQDWVISPVPAQRRLFNWVVGLAVKAGHDALQEALSDAMRQLKTSGRLEAIFQNHGLSYSPPADH